MEGVGNTRQDSTVVDTARGRPSQGRTPNINGGSYQLQIYLYNDQSIANSRKYLRGLQSAGVPCVGVAAVYSVSYERATADNAGWARQSTSRCNPGPRPAPRALGTRIRRGSTHHGFYIALIDRPSIRQINETDYPVAYLRQWSDVR
ncbi:hypothetical protein ACJJTC_004404 [Scirpophaga incertulas]